MFYTLPEYHLLFRKEPIIFFIIKPFISVKIPDKSITDNCYNVLILIFIYNI